jgi:hypothetical protein
MKVRSPSENAALVALSPAGITSLKQRCGLAWSYDHESYAGGSVATGRVSHAGQVKGDDPDKKGYPGPPG